MNQKNYVTYNCREIQSEYHCVHHNMENVVIVISVAKNIIVSGCLLDFLLFQSQTHH